jgi:hypothetical protein
VDPKTTANTAAVTATIGGQNADVVYSIAAPGSLGLYQVAVKVPAGVTGNPALILKQGAVNSNSVTVAGNNRLVSTRCGSMVKIITSRSCSPVVFFATSGFAPASKELIEFGIWL